MKNKTKVVVTPESHQFTLPTGCGKSMLSTLLAKLAKKSKAVVFITATPYHN